MCLVLLKKTTLVSSLFCFLFFFSPPQHLSHNLEDILQSFTAVDECITHIKQVLLLFTLS